MKNFLINFIYNREENRVRGTFIQLAKLLFLYATFIYILLMIFFEIKTGKETLSSLATFILGLIGVISAEQAYGYKLYSDQKKSENEVSQLIDKAMEIKKVGEEKNA